MRARDARESVTATALTRADRLVAALDVSRESSHARRRLWVLYDLANTIFSMGVVSLYFSLYVRDEVGADRADSSYSVITAISMALIFLVSPVLGAMTDRARRRMPFLVWSTILCCACTALLARGPFALSVLLFIAANADLPGRASSSTTHCCRKSPPKPIAGG